MILALKDSRQRANMSTHMQVGKFTDHSMVDGKSLGDWNGMMDPALIKGETSEAYRS